MVKFLLTIIKLLQSFKAKDQSTLRPRSRGNGRIFVQIRLAFTRHPRNRTNSSTANRTNSRPKKIRPSFLRDRSQILTNPCEHRNRCHRKFAPLGNSPPLLQEGDIPRYFALPGTKFLGISPSWGANFLGITSPGG